MLKTDAVPNKDLCEKIPKGQFKNTLFVYREFENGMYCLSQRDILPTANAGKITPAPILVEIMDKLGNCHCVKRLKSFDDGVPRNVFNFIVKGVEYNIFNTNASEAGLATWLKINNLH